MIKRLIRHGARLSVLFTAAVLSAQAALPSELEAAVKNLREQRSYAWEVINGDPGPVEQTIQTKRGPVTTVQRNPSPHVKGRYSANGEMALERDWPDGMAMQTFVAADGATATNTPEGWLSHQDILEAIAAERLLPGGPSSRLQWLARAEAVDTQRPSEELEPFIGPQRSFDQTGDSYSCTVPIPAGTPGTAAAEGQVVGTVNIVIHLEGGVLRDYEVKTEIARYVTRAKLLRTGSLSSATGPSAASPFPMRRVRN